MKRAAILSSLVVAVFSMQGCSTSGSNGVANDSLLTGVRTIYVAPPLQTDFQRTLSRELPEVTVVANPKDADAILSFSINQGVHLAGSTNATYESVSSATNGSATYETHTVTVPVGEPTSSRGYSTGIAQRQDGRSILIHQGFSSDSFATEFLLNFVKAWRAANRAAS